MMERKLVDGRYYGDSNKDARTPNSGLNSASSSGRKPYGTVRNPTKGFRRQNLREQQLLFV